MLKIIRPILRSDKAKPNHLAKRIHNKGKVSYFEVEGDVFLAASDVSLAHCVAADMNMSRGVAVKFKKVFGSINELKSQNIRPGGCAILKSNQRYVYYLVTKRNSNEKPTYNTLTSSIYAMKQHMIVNGVMNLALPKIGTGIDGLDWEKVKQSLINALAETKAIVTVYVPN